MIFKFDLELEDNSQDQFAPDEMRDALQEHIAQFFDHFGRSVIVDLRRVDVPYPAVMNKRMRERLISGECLDVRVEGEAIAEHIFKLKRFVEDIDYCDAATEAWIWSIGKHRETGEIFASFTNEFYQDSNYECLFLR